MARVRRTTLTAAGMTTVGMALVVALVVTALPAAAGDDMERTQLANLVRQLDLLQRSARHSETLARDNETHYHFDYARLATDLERVRAGIDDYLSPSRAQPRDPVTLLGDYRQDNVASAPLKQGAGQ